MFLQRLNALKPHHLVTTYTKHFIATAAAAVRLAEKGILDGEKLILHQESRELCKCDQCWESYNASSSSLINTKLSSQKVKVEEIISTDDKFISIKWSDGHVGVLPRNDIAAFQGMKLPCDEDHELALRQNHTLHFWDTDFPELKQEFVYKELLEDATLLKQCLIKLLRDGFARVIDVPARRDEVRNFIRNLELGPILPTNYEDIFNVYDMGDSANNLAYTNGKLPLHTDLPFFTQPPGIFLFHCIKACKSGGESVYIDGFAAARKMKEEHLNDYRILAKQELIFRDFQSNFHIVTKHPIIRESQGGQALLRVVCNPALYNPWDFINTGTVQGREEWYAAWKIWRGYIGDPARHCAFKMKEGEMTLFDNWRVLHGRNAFVGTRYMQGTYIEHAHVISKFLQL